jgi:hypothetical protein
MKVVGGERHTFVVSGNVLRRDGIAQDRHGREFVGGDNNSAT